MNKKNNKRLEIKVYGIVQGVNFRWYTREYASKLGLTGYVRNLLDGSVEIVAEGPEEALYNLLKFAKRGPPSAQVYNVTYKWSKPQNKFTHFRIAY
ncbi:MAG: acylphosphatase [Candidatus Heimdallarchaeaceae archaeon]